MKGLSFLPAVENLPPLCLRLMSRTDVKSVESLTREVNDLINEDGDPGAKVMSLGALLIGFCGRDVLAGAIASIDGVVRPVGGPARVITPADIGSSAD